MDDSAAPRNGCLARFESGHTSRKRLWACLLCCGALFFTALFTMTARGVGYREYAARWQAESEKDRILASRLDTVIRQLDHLRTDDLDEIKKTLSLIQTDIARLQERTKTRPVTAKNP